jgi:hypothetical protein
MGSGRLSFAKAAQRDFLRLWLSMDFAAERRPVCLYDANMVWPSLPFRTQLWIPFCLPVSPRAYVSKRARQSRKKRKEDGKDAKRKQNQPTTNTTPKPKITTHKPAPVTMLSRLSRSSTALTRLAMRQASTEASPLVVPIELVSDTL